MLRLKSFTFFMTASHSIFTASLKFFPSSRLFRGRFESLSPSEWHSNTTLERTKLLGDMFTISYTVLKFGRRLRSSSAFALFRSATRVFCILSLVALLTSESTNMSIFFMCIRAYFTRLFAVLMSSSMFPVCPLGVLGVLWTFSAFAVATGCCPVDTVSIDADIFGPCCDFGLCSCCGIWPSTFTICCGWACDWACGCASGCASGWA
mmetsp:Transcript_431/g.1473  ORF Transcript_431/g.1473 Transcript_431/m.1473 type:complete len:207 (+) Transcript_431:736-1356(+)